MDRPPQAFSLNASPSGSSLGAAAVTHVASPLFAEAQPPRRLLLASSQATWHGHVLGARHEASLVRELVEDPRDAADAVVRLEVAADALPEPLVFEQASGLRCFEAW